MDDGKRLVRVEEIAKYVGVTVRRIQQLTQEGIIQSEAPNDGKVGRMYDAQVTLHKLMQHYRMKADGRSSKDALDQASLIKAEMTNRKLQAEAELAEGRAHSTDDVRRVFNDVIGILRIRMFGLEAHADRFVMLPDREAAADKLRTLSVELATLCRQYNADDFFSRNPEYLEDDTMDDDGGDIIYGDEYDEEDEG